jgi:hypothetical protein
VVRPFAVELAASSLDAAAGSTASIRGAVARVAPFTGKVDVKVDGLPEGVTAAPGAVAPEASQFEIQLTLAPAAKPGSANLSLTFSTPLGDPQKPVVHALPGIPVMLKVLPAAK